MLAGSTHRQRDNTLIGPRSRPLNRPVLADAFKGQARPMLCAQTGGSSAVERNGTRPPVLRVLNQYQV